METGCASGWSRQLAERIDAVYAAHGALVDHRKRFPSLQGFLGDPMSRVWFVARRMAMPQRGVLTSSLKGEAP
jgi:hypothetical protein